MLKIYQTYANQGKIEVKDYIEFNDGKFDTGYEGFGQVYSGNLKCLRAHYELQKLKSFKEYIKTVKMSDGYVEDFALYAPYSYKMLKEKFASLPKDADTYQQYGLNEEGIILFTNYIRLEYSNTNLIYRIFGRYPENSMYLLLPNANFNMLLGNAKPIKENYEVLQSQSLGKRLVLQKMNREI